ncbi:MAG: hypothetical protein HY329_03980 [Chloroflexi bacterium]|nr:hypothetical protein [Chloroflexota bacterium]
MAEPTPIRPDVAPDAMEQLAEALVNLAWCFWKRQQEPEQAVDDELPKAA